MSTAVRSIVCFLCVAAIMAAAAPLPGAPAAEVAGSVTEVTLYRGQALVTRVIPVDAPQGSLEIVVGDLPEQVVADSLFAEGSEGTEIRAVRFRTRAVGETPRDEVRQLDEAIEQGNEALEAIRKGQEVLAKRIAYLDQLEGFVAPTAKTDLSQGVLDATALEKITLFSFDQRQAIAKEQLDLEKQAKEANEELSLLQRKRAELTGEASQTVREAVLFLEKHVDGKQSIRLNYLVGNCGWSPAYTFRAAAAEAEIAVECNALIHQMTGEDWNGVTLTLSTASPALSASGPGLAPFPVTLGQDGSDGQISASELASQLTAIRGRQDLANAKNRIAATLGENIGSSWAVNSAANEFQALELLSGKDLVTTLQSGEAELTEGPSLSYSLPGAVSLASRSDQQMVRVLRTSFQSRFYHVATPVLTGFVYREAELINTSEDDLLAGPVSAYLDGRFVGRGEIPTVARGQMFVVGFGAEPQLRARRELAARSESVQGGNRELRFQYRLIVENYKDEVVPVRIYDRLPHCDREADLRVTLDEMKDPLDDDALYVRRERPKGILRWEIDVPAGATRENARIIEYGFSLEFDRNFRLSTSGADGQQQQREFEQLQRMRINPSAAFE